MEQIKKLERMGACQEALDWLDRQLCWDTAWRKCERGDWMLWLLERLSRKPVGDERRKLVLTACECAKLALPYVPEGEVRPLNAIKTAEAWARRQADVTLFDVQVAAYDASAAAYVADGSAYATVGAHAAAARAAARAARVAIAEADAAARAARASATAAALYAAAGTSLASYASTLALCADIVRAHYPEAPKL